MTFKEIITISLLAFATISCGGGDDDPFFFDDGDTEVEDIFTDDNNLRVGEATVVRTRFSFDNEDVFGDDESVSVIVRLPSELRFRLATAEIQEVGSDDNEVGAQVFNCPTGEQYLLFELDDNDLSGAEDPSGDADAELSLTVDAVSPALSGAVISALASRNSFGFNCGDVFESEDADVVIINP